MAENVYLRGLREQYSGIQKSIAGVQSRAAEAKRDLTNEELRSVTEMGEKGKSLYTQIEDLSEIELRNAKVAAMDGKVQAAIVAGRTQPDGDEDGDEDGEPDDGTRSRKLGGARTKDRDPGFYTRGGGQSFLGDQWRSANLNDTAAKDRLTKYTNAMRENVHLRDVLGTAGGGGTGLVPPVWLAEQFAPVLHRRLRVASVLRQVPWSGPFPWTIPVAAVAATNTSPTAEGNNPTETNPTYTTITVTPTTISGYAEVSRQLLEAANPAVDAIIWGDLLGDFYDKAEIATVSAIEGQANINLTTSADGSIATTSRNVLLDAIAAVSDNGGGDADVFFGRQARWSSMLKWTDVNGRPMILSQRYNPQNAIGDGNLAQGYRSPIQGEIENLVAVTSPSVLATRGYVINSQELLFSMSAPQQFTFEQPAGPALVRIGVWGYVATTAGRRPSAVSRIAFTTN